MNPKDWIDLLQRLFAGLSERRNPELIICAPTVRNANPRT